MSANTTTPAVTVTAVSIDDVEEQGGSLGANYQVNMTIGDLRVVVNGWYNCGWIAPGASQDLDGSGLANWGSSQPGGWSVCDGDGQVSGRPTIEIGEDDDGAPCVLIQQGYGMGDDVTLSCADLGIDWPNDDVDADDDDAIYELTQAENEAREAVQSAADAISTALDEAIPPPPAEPDGEQVFDGLPELVRDGDELPVRAGKYLGCDVRIAIRDGDDYVSYHPDESWEHAAERVIGAWVIGAVRAQVGDEED
jgi:hypothetical protein